LGFGLGFEGLKYERLGFEGFFELRLLLEILNAFFTGNGFLWTFAGAGVGFGSLTTNWQSQSVANAPITANVSQAIDVLLNITSQRAFDHVVLFEDRRKAADFFVGQIASSFVRIDVGLLAKLASGMISDSEQIGQRNNGLTIIRNIDTE